MKNYISIILAVVLAVFAVIGVNSYIERQKRKWKEKRTYVCAASRIIEKNDIIRPDMIKKVAIDKSAKSRDMVGWNEAASLLNRTAQKTFQPNEIILWSNIGEEIPKETLAQKVEIGSRALTLSVSGPNAVMDMIHPNDQVDLIGTFSVPKVEMRTVPMPDGKVSKIEVPVKEEASFILLQNVTVLAVGRRYDKNATGGNLTVLVTPEEAIYLVFASQNGKITAILRNPEDVSDLKNIQVINYEKMLDMAALEGLNTKRRQKIIEEIKGGVTKEQVIETNE